MILDYGYDKNIKQMSISYIDENGNKKILHYDNLQRFRTYYYTPSGRYNTWDEAKCDVKMTSDPSKFDLKEFIYNLDEETQKKINGKTFPKLYSWDIETQIKSQTEFTDPTVADMPVLTISVVAPNLSAIVLGTRTLEDPAVENIRRQYFDYLESIPFYQENRDLFEPKFQYIYFETEEAMLKWFLKNIVAKVPILAGWNSIGYDWCYVTSRIRNFYPNISIKDSSWTKTLTFKNYTNQRKEDIRLPHPMHTLVLDMMDIIDTEDAVVMPIKESLNLDYIAHESLGANKIEYSGSLQDLYNTDYPRYVFYNCIDSVLVQLIDKRFKTMDHIYMYSIYCTEKIGSCFSKIALTEALILKDFRERDVKIVYEKKEQVERGRLLGAHVNIPVPGLHNYVVCNDFSSLYPRSIECCNLSFDNFLGTYYNDVELDKYRKNPAYIVIGPNVFKNDGTFDKPHLGDFIGQYLDDESLEPYRKDPKYFVSVNGSVYKNDKQYTIPRIQSTLYNLRKVNKYISKKLDAQVMSDISHIKENHPGEMHQYDDDVIKKLEELGFVIKCGEDVRKMSKERLHEFEKEVRREIIYCANMEQATKLMMNSIYGGTSHVSFYWFNISVANDITGEGRNLKLMMIDHLSRFWKENWVGMKEWHKKWGIEVDTAKAHDIFSVTDYKPIIYGDTDSTYMEYQSLIDTVIGSEKWTREQKRDFVLKVNLEFLDDHNNQFITEYYKTRHANRPYVHAYELETLALRGCWINVKKRYGQILLYKDGKYFDMDNLPVKVKGLEVIKSSYPAISRKFLKNMLKFMLEYDGKYLSQELNLLNIKQREEWNSAPIEDICANVRCNKYIDYVADDTKELVLKPKCPPNVQALARYNWLNNTHKFGAEPLYGGKIKQYIVKQTSRKTKSTQVDQFFGFESNKYPKWADEYAPIDRSKMYQNYVLDPINRILEAVGMPKLMIDGSIQMGLF